MQDISADHTEQFPERIRFSVKNSFKMNYTLWKTKGEFLIKILIFSIDSSGEDVCIRVFIQAILFIQ